MFRIAVVPVVALALLVAGCSNDGEGGSGAAGAGGAGDGSTEAGATTGPTTTLEVFVSAEDTQIETPFSIPPLDTDEIDVMIDEANEDDEVTTDEIAAVLQVAGVEPELAACEAEILVGLGVEDIGGAVELQQAVDSMTDETRAQLAACFN